MRCDCAVVGEAVGILLTRRIPLQKGSIEDIFAFCQETQKTLKIFKQAVIDLYVQWHNLEDKIDLLIQTHYHLKGHSKVTGAKKAGEAPKEGSSAGASLGHK